MGQFSAGDSRRYNTDASTQRCGYRRSSAVILRRSLRCENVDRGYPPKSRSRGTSQRQAWGNFRLATADATAKTRRHSDAATEEVRRSSSFVHYGATGRPPLQGARLPGSAGDSRRYSEDASTQRRGYSINAFIAWARTRAGGRGCRLRRGRRRAGVEWARRKGARCKCPARE
jgi:hypothetical protein